MTARVDFIIIGAMKCATSTLHEQLARQPGVRMSDPKEPCFFSDDEAWDRGLEWYDGLFADAAEDDLCGESSTHYTKLPTHPRTIERLRSHAGIHVRFVYVMRHPIDRLVSHYVHEWTQRVIDDDLDAAVTRHPELIDYGRYAMQLEPWLETFGRDRVLPVFFDAIRERPQAELTRVARFLGHAGEVEWVEDVAAQNVSRDRLRRSAWRDRLMNLPGARALRRTLVPRSVRDRVKSRWTMQERPALSPAMEAHLVETYDKDLAQLGAWLGIELGCANFKDVGRSVVPQWTHLDDRGSHGEHRARTEVRGERH